MKPGPTTHATKLRLARQTIARLNHPELKAVLGGNRNPAALPTSIPCLVTVSYYLTCWNDCGNLTTSLSKCEEEIE